ncbi:MAG: DNA repair protein RecO, partial [Pseudomonadota bacterium]
GRLAALSSACAILDAALPERDPQPQVFARLDALLRAVTAEADWAKAYALWERDLLGDLGFGLDLSACAATGATTDLIYVSPKTARAVSAAAGAIYKAKLLPLPAFFLSPDAPADPGALADAVRTTGFFLEREVFVALDRPVPAARRRLEDRFESLP